MRVLISGGPCLLRDRLEKRLGARHDIRVVDLSGGDGDAANAFVAQSDIVVHMLPEAGTAPDHELVWRTTEQAYALLSRMKKDGRFILISSVRIFESCPMEWRVTEDYRPRPSAEIGDVIVHLGEAVTREAVRALPIRGVVLRCGTIVDDGAAPDPRAVHVDDVVKAVELGFTFEPPEGFMWNRFFPRHGWWVFHIVSAGKTQRVTAGKETGEVLGFTPDHDVTGGLVPKTQSRTPVVQISSRPGPIRKVAVFGAWGPLGSVVAENLKNDFEMRLCDVRSYEEALTIPPVVRGDPRPRRVSGNHEECVVDVTDPEQVARAAEGMDALVNVSVHRVNPHLAFGINAAGAFNIVNAALRHGIRRVIHTGPEEVSDRQQGGHWPDFDIASDVSPRPGVIMYFLSKYLGTEVCRLYAEAHGLEIPTLLFGHLRNPRDLDLDTIEGMPIVVSWEDAAEAVRCALTVPALPRPQEVFNIVADLPHEKLSNRTAKEVLGWQPRDRLEMLWTRTFK